MKRFLDGARAGLWHSQDAAYLHPGAAHGRSDTQGGQDPAELGIQSRQEQEVIDRNIVRKKERDDVGYKPQLHSCQCRIAY